MTLRERRRQERIYDIKDVAFHLIQDGGVECLSLRAIARLLGVSNKTPQRYFASTAAVIDSLRAEGYADLARELKRVDRAPCGPRHHLVKLAVTELSWARRHRTQYSLFTDPDGSAQESRVLREARLAAVGVHVSTFARLCQETGSDRPDGIEFGLAQTKREVFESRGVSLAALPSSAVESFFAYYAVMSDRIEDGLRRTSEDAEDRLRQALDAIMVATRATT